jgi:hypothetical protein
LDSSVCKWNFFEVPVAKFMTAYFIVLLKAYIAPWDCGWYALPFTIVIPKLSKVYWIILLINYPPLSVWIIFG